MTDVLDQNLPQALLRYIERLGINGEVFGPLAAAFLSPSIIFVSKTNALLSPQKPWTHMEGVHDVMLHEDGDRSLDQGHDEVLNR